MLDFGMTDLPTSRNLQDWQEWLNKQGKPTTTDNSEGKVKPELRYAGAYEQYQFAIEKAETNGRILRDEKEAYHYLRDEIEHPYEKLLKWKTWKVYLERYFHFVHKFTK